MKNQNELSKIVYKIRYFKYFSPEDGKLVRIIWSDGDTTEETWKEGAYSFNEWEVLVVPVYWYYIDKKEL